MRRQPEDARLYRGLRKDPEGLELHRMTDLDVQLLGRWQAIADQRSRELSKAARYGRSLSELAPPVKDCVLQAQVSTTGGRGLVTAEVWATPANLQRLTAAVRKVLERLGPSTDRNPERHVGAVFLRCKQGGINTAHGVVMQECTHGDTGRGPLRCEDWRARRVANEPGLRSFVALLLGEGPNSSDLDLYASSRRSPVRHVVAEHRRCWPRTAKHERWRGLPACELGQDKRQHRVTIEEYKRGVKP